MQDQFRDYVKRLIWICKDESIVHACPIHLKHDSCEVCSSLYVRSRTYEQQGSTQLESRSPVNGAVGELGWINGYSYVNGNPVNLTDHSGMCPDSPVSEASLCEDLVERLLQWGVIVVYNKQSRDPYECLDPQVQECLPESGNQRWTLDEMKAIWSGFKVFEGAQRQLQMSYSWPLSRSVQVVKRESIGTTGAALGRHEYQARLIELSATQWGSRNTDTYLNQQYRAWLVLHEFSHIFAKDRIATKSYNGQSTVNNITNFADVTYPTTLMRGTRFGFTSNRGIPTAYSSDSDKEAFIEAVTATLWNNGYTNVSGFTQNAGGRTAYQGQTGSDSYNGVQYVLTNVRDIRGNNDLTLEQWVIDYVIGDRDPQE
jgi:hypothetical protein